MQYSESAIGAKMEQILGGLAFAGLAVAQLLAVIALHNMRPEEEGHPAFRKTKFRVQNPHPVKEVFVGLKRSL